MGRSSERLSASLSDLLRSRILTSEIAV